MTHTPTSWGRADLHMHTDLSDGLPTVQALLDHVARLGTLDVIAITDHDTLDNSLWAYGQRERYPFDVVPGVEVTSREGHVLAWWVTTPIPHGLSLEETVMAVHEAGGLASLAHPFHVHVGETRVGARRYLRDVALLQRIGFDAAEVHNAAVTLPGANAYARHALADVAIAVTGSSDAHTLSGIGTGVTRFPGHTGDALRAALLARNTHAEGGWWPAQAYVRYLHGRVTGKATCTPPGVQVN